MDRMDRMDLNLEHGMGLETLSPLWRNFHIVFHAIPLRGGAAICSEAAVKRRRQPASHHSHLALHLSDVDSQQALNQTFVGMAKKRKAAAPVVEAPAEKHARAAGDPPGTSGSGYKNKEKWLVVSSRGITFR